MKRELAFAAAGALLLGGHAHAQTRPEADQSARAVESSPYRSAFEGYQPFKDEPVAAWREVNDSVGRVGGHMGVLRAERAGTPSPAQPLPAPSTAPTPAPHSMKDAHDKHPK